MLIFLKLKIDTKNKIYSFGWWECPFCMFLVIDQRKRQIYNSYLMSALEEKLKSQITNSHINISLKTTNVDLWKENVRGCPRLSGLILWGLWISAKIFESMQWYIFRYLLNQLTDQRPDSGVHGAMLLAWLKVNEFVGAKSLWDLIFF